MNKKVIYLIGAIVGVAVVTLLTSQNEPISPVITTSPEALPVNGLVSATATPTAAVVNTETHAVGATGAAPAMDAFVGTAPVPAAGTAPDMTDMPEDASMPASDPSFAPANGGDELPADAEVAPLPAITNNVTNANTDTMGAAATAAQGNMEKIVPPSEGQ